MFREIRTSERITEEDKERSENYKKIKPERETDLKKAKSFWEDIFSEIRLGILED